VFSSILSFALANVLGRPISKHCSNNTVIKQHQLKKT